jgi:hypothetical protein
MPYGCLALIPFRLVAVLLVSVGAPSLSAQTISEPWEIKCPAPLGKGVSTEEKFCDVLTGRDPLEGIIIRIPPHRGEALLSFDLHNRQTYSEQEILAKRAFSRYTATIGVLTLENELLLRAVIQSEFRTADDLVDRITGGAGPGGLKAVAPTGSERISVEIPSGINEISILGEELEVMRVDRQEHFTSPGRPIATISSVSVDYRLRR